MDDLRWGDVYRAKFRQNFDQDDAWWRIMGSKINRLLEPEVISAMEWLGASDGRFDGMFPSVDDLIDAIFMLKKRAKQERENQRAVDGLPECQYCQHGWILTPYVMNHETGQKRWPKGETKEFSHPHHNKGKPVLVFDYEPHSVVYVACMCSQGNSRPEYDYQMADAARKWMAKQPANSMYSIESAIERKLTDDQVRLKMQKIAQKKKREKASV